MSANIIGSKISDTRFKPLTEIENNNGPNIDPYETPHFILAKVVLLLLKLIKIVFDFLDCDKLYQMPYKGQ